MNRGDRSFEFRTFCNLAPPMRVSCPLLTVQPHWKQCTSVHDCSLDLESPCPYLSFCWSPDHSSVPDSIIIASCQTCSQPLIGSESSVSSVHSAHSSTQRVSGADLKPFLSLSPSLPLCVCLLTRLEVSWGMSISHLPSPMLSTVPCTTQLQSTLPLFEWWFKIQEKVIANDQRGWFMCFQKSRLV